METVLVTGINGNLGKVVSSIFLNAGYQVVGIDRDNSNDITDQPNVSFYTSDLVDADSTKSTLDQIFSRNIPKNKVAQSITRLMVIRVPPSGT